MSTSSKTKPQQCRWRRRLVQLLMLLWMLLAPVESSVGGKEATRAAIRRAMEVAEQAAFKKAKLEHRP